MRLIDADEFIKDLGLDEENTREDNIGEIVTLEDFDRQPTAFDLESVIQNFKALLRQSDERKKRASAAGECDSFIFYLRLSGAIGEILNDIKSATNTTNEGMEELKKCPFCGAKVAEITNAHDLEECGNFEHEDCLCNLYEDAGNCAYYTVV